VGPNGAGKSTLLDVLAGRITPAEGEVVMGTTVVLGVYDQRGRELDPAMRGEDAVAGPTRRPDWEDAAFLERFWFDGDAQRAPIGLLSGGERRRLQLVLTLRAKPNVLFLDEPTNDLDLDTLRVLEDVLETWPGAVVVVSHDRAFLERTVTDVLVLDEEHPGRRVPGGYAAWEERRRARRVAGRAVAAAPRPQTRGTKPKVPPAPSTPTPSTLRRRQRDAEKEMAALERKKAKLVDELNAAGADRDALARIGSEIADLEQQIAEAEDRWLSVAEQLE
jgi:ATP-binding cassette subfamily F protein uup